ncbi:MAG: NAD-binding protein [Pseudomonadota bacterium]
MGAAGTGQATKLVNQILVLNNFVVMAEALRMAEAFGVEAEKIPDALASGYAGSNLLPSVFERMVPRDWTPTGYARQVLKDLEMIEAAAKDRKLAMPVTGQSLMLYRMLVGMGRGERDCTAVFDLLPEGNKDAPA